MKNKRGFIKIFALTMALSVFSINSSVGAESFVNIDSIQVDGEMIKGDLGIEAQKYVPEIQPYSSTIVYKKDGYVPQSLVFKQLGWVNAYQRFHNTSVTIPSGVSYTYTWERSVTKTSTSSHNISNSLRLQGGAKFISEIDYKLDYTYNKSKTLTVSQGMKSQIQVKEPGTYTVDFYMKGASYDITGKWKAYTIANPNVETTVTRNLGNLIEATDFLHVDIKRSNS